MKYVSRDVLETIAEKLAGLIGFTQEETARLLEVPQDTGFGDAALPCFSLAKQLKKPPQLIASQIAEAWNDAQIKADTAGGYVNFRLNRQAFTAQWVHRVNEEGFGSSQSGQGRRVIIDMSSPNIAKPFGIGHLRSTMIGNALYRLYTAAGYDAVRVNHLGDWGTQFGKQITAYQRWGDPKRLTSYTIQDCLDLYVKFHEEADHDPTLEAEARDWFRRLEQGDEEAVQLWRFFVDLSLEEFKRMYKVLGVEFDEYLGESFYNDKIGAVIQNLKDKQLLEESDGAMVVRLRENIPPCLILKSDGTTIYPARDLATAIYRRETMKGDLLLYVVGSEQSLHFTQVFEVLKRMGHTWARDCRHVAFGLMKFEGKKMSTRRGRVIFLEDVLKEAVQHALEILEHKRPDLENKAETAEAIGIGAIIFADLKNYRLNEIDFSMQDALNFDGETGPYLQYTYVRTRSLLEKEGHGAGAGDMAADPAYLAGDHTWHLLKTLHYYPDQIERAVETNDPSLLAKYLIDTAHAFNRFYANERILSELEAEKETKLLLVRATAHVLAHGMDLLGLKTPARM
ncbi:arginine--tRNA ligase [Paenibacillus gansuensis]|uniref:Arginine--tRNA ligase n=1 Tax=Paenibacillus gansuensis TaxID=306542 RepID=A0ABW5PDD8_9BACL